MYNVYVKSLVSESHGPAPVAGFAWQASLYSALSNSSLVVAFVSEDYLKSKMCQEEFAIASSQFAAREYDSQLVMVQLESLEGAAVDPMFLACPSISTRDGDGRAKQVLVSWVQRSEDFRKSVSDGEGRKKNFF